MKTISVLSWNVQNMFRVPEKLRWDSVWHLVAGYTSFEKVLPYLLETSPDVIALQEVCDAELKLASNPGLSKYHVFIPTLNATVNHGRSGSNYNVILSKYPILKTKEIPLPECGKNSENCTRVDIQIGQQVLRIYVCHFPIFGVGIATRLRNIAFILSDAEKHAGPVIICGDLNTTIPKSGWRRVIVRLWHQVLRRELVVDGQFIREDEREAFNAAIAKRGFADVLDLDTPTWSPLKSSSWQLFNLKLDWFATKGLQLEKVSLGEYISDHRAILAKLRLQ